MPEAPAARAAGCCAPNGYLAPVWCVGACVQVNMAHREPLLGACMYSECIVVARQEGDSPLNPHPATLTLQDETLNVSTCQLALSWKILGTTATAARFGGATAR